MKYTNRKIAFMMRQRSYKLTPQRRAVLNVIGGAAEHFSPAEIYQWVKQEHPDVGLVTVYRTLNILTEMGLLCEVHTGGKHRSYVMRRPVEHHHHLVCSQCGTVVDFASCDLTELEGKLSRETGFKINSHLLEFSGYCQGCQQK